MEVIVDTTSQVQKEFAEGFSAEHLNKAREIIESKISEIQKLAERASQDTWNKAVEQASPYLDKVPDLKQALNDNAGKFVAAGVAQSGQAAEIFKRLKEAGGELAKNPEKVKELKEFVLQKAKQAEEEVRKRSRGKGQDSEEEEDKENKANKENKDKDKKGK